MSNLAKLPHDWRPKKCCCKVIIETPKGRRNKFNYDEDYRLFSLGGLLPEGLSFPYDFGFIPSTRADDGDPLDVLVLTEEGLLPGCVVEVRLVGVIEARQSEIGKKGRAERNDRLIGEIETPFNPPTIHSLARLGAKRIDEIEHFFVSYNQVEGKRFEPFAR